MIGGITTQNIQAGASSTLPVLLLGPRSPSMPAVLDPPIAGNSNPVNTPLSAIMANSSQLRHAQMVDGRDSSSH